MRQIGYISACIAGDYRYTSRVYVTLSEDGDVCEIVRSERAPVGGMDGPGGSYDAGVHFRCTLRGDEITPKAIVSAIWRSFDSIITDYGKPTKNFEWSRRDRWDPKVKGISQAKVAKILKEWQ